MLFVFTGNDVIKVREEAHDFLTAPRNEGTPINQITAEVCTADLLKDLAGGVSLFGGREITILDTPSESAEALDAVTEYADVLKESPNWFVLIEGKLLAAQSKPLKKHANEYFETKVDKKDERFNVFSLTEALLRKDKKSLWVLLQRARQAGLGAEEIIGTLFWQVKTMRLALLSGSASEAGLKPFVYSKAKGGLQKYKEEEVHELSRKLLRVYHDGHLGKVDIDNALERFVLSL